MVNPPKEKPLRDERDEMIDLTQRTGRWSL